MIGVFVWFAMIVLAFAWFWHRITDVDKKMYAERFEREKKLLAAAEAWKATQSMTSIPNNTRQNNTSLQQ